MNDLAGPPFKRARNAQSKSERRRSILDAAQHLFRAGRKLPKVDDIATASGLAKGTVYLYFDSREEIYLTLVQEQLEKQFAALECMLEDSPTLAPDVFSKWLMRYICDEPAFLPLACIVTLVIEQNLKSGLAVTYKRQLDQDVSRVGQKLERAMIGLKPGQGARLLLALHSYLIGLWQNSHGMRTSGPLKSLPVLRVSFEEDALQGIHALSRGFVALSLRD